MISFSRVAACELHSLSFLAKLGSSMQFVANIVNACTSYRSKDRKNIERTESDKCSVI